MNNFVALDDLIETNKKDAGLPIYKYDSRYVYPIEISNYDMTGINKNSSRVIRIDIPVDEDIARYWEGQLVYTITYDHKSKSDNIFVVKSVDLEYDEDYYEVESFEVCILPS